MIANWIPQLNWAHKESDSVGRIHIILYQALDSIQIAGLRMSSQSKRVKINDILNPLTDKSSKSANSQKPVDEGLYSKAEKLVISFPSDFEQYWPHPLLSPAVRPGNSPSTPKVHYCPMNNCSESRPTRRKLDTHFLKAHMPDTRWRLQTGSAGITKFASSMSLAKGKSCVDGWVKHTGLQFWSMFSINARPII